MGTYTSTALYVDLLSDLSEACPGFDAWNAADFWPGMTWRQAAAMQLKHSILVKYIDEVEPTAESKAWAKFLAANETCGDWELSLSSTWDEVLWGEFVSSIHNFWYKDGLPLVSSYDEVLDLAAPGPGAAILARGFDFYTKLFDSPLSVSSEDLYNVYRSYLSANHSRWSYAEDIRHDRYGGPKIRASSRLHFAEKRVDIKRVIFAEPSLNVLYQKGFGEIIVGRLKEVFNIDLTTQPDYNRWLAYIGSLTDEVVTIDLVSASDLNATRMCEASMPKDFVDWLKLFRTSSVEKDGELVELNMVSTMGNGFTFPLETMIFSCVVAAVYRARGIPLLRNSKRGDWIWPGNFGVFGDDIIVVKEAAEDVLRLLRIIGHHPNYHKTFVEGPFRESCGADYYLGRNIRGVYVKRLTKAQDRFVAINLLNDWSSRTGIPLKRTIAGLLRTVPKHFVPPYENEDAGIRAPLGYVSDPKLTDGNTGTYNVLYKCWRARRPTWFVDYRTGRVHRDKLLKRLKGRVRNSNIPGLILAFLRGDVESMQCNVRLHVTLYTAEWRESPGWDYLEPAILPGSPNLANWKRACWANFPCRPAR